MVNYSSSESEKRALHRPAATTIFVICSVHVHVYVSTEKKTTTKNSEIFDILN